ncbi:biotin transporter BioY [Atopobacter phocae]|uniref:biotin transporter BioY n=1 Tax=Atopobacter phocae TaxID=136492 RepID=UPI0004727947|nr:biotin transporter BioY [Atopobacter phocae]
MKSSSTKYLILASLFAALTFLFGYISIPVGPVPITLQTLGVNLSGMLLPSPFGALAMTVHLLLKVIMGANPLTTPSFGFLIGFILQNILLAAYLKKYSFSFSVKHLVPLSLIALLTPYMIGFPYMFYMVKYVFHLEGNLLHWLNAGFFIFLPGDILKWIVSVILYNRLRRIKQIF